MSKVRVITALFDIGRKNTNDGRSMDQYLEWFDVTLKLKVPMTIYTEDKFLKFIEERRDMDPYYTRIVIQKLSEIPMYKHKEKINKVLGDPTYLSKIKDPSRIECNLDFYNIIQYSKFAWLDSDIRGGEKNDFYFWMDAGCSRFFSDFNLELDWPNVNNLSADKFIIQGNINTISMFSNMNIDDYKWDNNCILVGTLFGGRGDVVSNISHKVIEILEREMLDLDMINNEQIALGILYKRNPELFDVYIDPYKGHLPIFKSLSI
jgi:hypothetical protein